MHARIILLCLSVLVLAGCQSAGSSGPSTLSIPTLATAEARAKADPRYAGIVVETNSGRVLYAENADARRHPASLTKMMTLYLVFEDLKAGRLSMNTPVPVSAKAAKQPPSKLGLKPGETISVRNAILALAVRSSNDVAVAVAEKISGSEAAFAARMTGKARALGLRATIFRNASGLPDSAQITTARDMAKLARALQTDFPGRYRVFSTQSFSYKGKRYTSTNRLLGALPGVDGIKTGYIRASGYNLAASARRRGKRIIVVVMGQKSGAARNGHVAALVNTYLPNRSGVFGR